MSETFDPSARRVLVPVTVVGPGRAHTFEFLLDTGANLTSMRAEYLRLLGLDPAAARRRRRMRSATGATAAPVLTVPRLVALGQTRSDFEIAAHDPPEAVTADGLLGLDFFPGLVLTLDFARGRASLNPPRRWWQVWK